MRAKDGRCLATSKSASTYLKEIVSFCLMVIYASGWSLLQWKSRCFLKSGRLRKFLTAFSKVWEEPARKGRFLYTRSRALVQRAFMLRLFFKRQTVCTLIHRRVSFVSTHSDRIQSAEILCFFVVLALIYSASYSLIFLTSHYIFLLAWLSSQIYYDRKLHKLLRAWHLYFIR